MLEELVFDEDPQADAAPEKVVAERTAAAALAGKVTDVDLVNGCSEPTPG